MKSVIAIPFILLSCLLHQHFAHAQTAESEMRINGVLNKSSVDLIISLAKEKTKYLIITSPGGEVTSSMRLGLWIKEKNITLIVKDICLSSCANYLFFAAKEKIILPNSVVAWHGSAEQKNFRELFEKYSELKRKATENPSSLLPDEIDYLQVNKRAFEQVEIARPLQKKFFDTIGVNEYLTRAGQAEGLSINGFWAYSIDDLRKSGIEGVHADADYGSEEYNEKIFKALKLRVKALPIHVDAGNEFDRH